MGWVCRPAGGGGAAIRMALCGHRRHNTGMNKIDLTTRLAGGILIVLWCVTPLHAQTGRRALPETPALNRTHQLSIRVLVRGGPAARVRDREWSQLFQEAGYRVTLVADNGGEAPGIRSRGTGRRVTVDVVGVITRGVLKLGQSQFRPGDVKPLKEFLDHLRQHGAEGPIRQRPTWGLTVPQYTEVLRLLAAGIDQELPLSSAVETVEALHLPRELTVTWTAEAAEVVRKTGLPGETIDLRRLSAGTGLAVALTRFGLGFRVLEHPRRGFILEVDVGGEEDNLWPVGWKNKSPMIHVVPLMYRSVNVDLQDEKIADVIDLVSTQIEIPWYYSHHQLASQRIDVDQISFSTPPGRETPSRLLQSIANENRMGIDLRTDEAGQVFLWCTTAAEQTAWKRRFSHVVPGQDDDRTPQP